MTAIKKNRTNTLPTSSHLHDAKQVSNNYLISLSEIESEIMNRCQGSFLKTILKVGLKLDA